MVVGKFVKDMAIWIFVKNECKDKKRIQKCNPLSKYMYLSHTIIAGEDLERKIKWLQCSITSDGKLLKNTPFRSVLVHVE